MHAVQKTYFQCGRCFATNQFVHLYQGSVLCVDCHWHMQQMNSCLADQSDLSRIDFGLPIVSDQLLWETESLQVRSSVSSLDSASNTDMALSTDVISATRRQSQRIEPVEYTIFDKDNRTALTGCLEIEIPSSSGYPTCEMKADIDSKFALCFFKDDLPHWPCSNPRLSGTWTPLQSSFPGIFHLMRSSC